MQNKNASFLSRNIWKIIFILHLKCTVYSLFPHVSLIKVIFGFDHGQTLFSIVYYSDLVSRIRVDICLHNMLLTGQQNPVYRLHIVLFHLACVGILRNEFYKKPCVATECPC